MSFDRVAALEWSETHTKEEMIDVMYTMAKRTKDAELKVKEMDMLKDQVEKLTRQLGERAEANPETDTVAFLMSEVNKSSNEIQCLKEKGAQAQDEVEESTKRLEKANGEIKRLKEELQQATLWVQRHPRESEHDNQKEVTRIANHHINLLQGLIRTKFLKDAAAKCYELKEKGTDKKDAEEAKENAIAWVLYQIQNQSRDFLQGHGIESTEYDRDAKTFVLRNRHCRMGVFTHCWPFDFTMLYGS